MLLGHNVRSPIDLVRGEIEYIGPQLKKVKEWLLDLNIRLDLLRESAREVGLAQSDYRKLYYDGKACVKVYSVGDKILLRCPGLHSKLEEAWKGPYEVLEVQSVLLMLELVCLKKRKTEGCSCEFVVPIS